MDWVANVNAILALIGTLVGLISTGVPLVILVVKSFKNKSKEDIIAKIKVIVEAAIAQAEKSGKAGADKKAMVIDIVKASLRADGIEASQYLDQISAYIDDCINFVNNVTKK